ncbi:unnamed protein product [Cylicocyclus nassatus]|uniref:Secreted protein n=1 Tax=Cylicocyclus nassatus TaxID=53992 RepID=A0AA36GUS9_CYLNA|nr:unnamed protein product [Cylicocyclus nassatus]
MGRLVFLLFVKLQSFAVTGIVDEMLIKTSKLKAQANFLAMSTRCGRVRSVFDYPPKSRHRPRSNLTASSYYTLGLKLFKRLPTNNEYYCDKWVVTVSFKLYRLRMEPAVIKIHFALSIASQNDLQA